MVVLEGEPPRWSHTFCCLQTEIFLCDSNIQISVSGYCFQVKKCVISIIIWDIFHKLELQNNQKKCNTHKQVCCIWVGRLHLVDQAWFTNWVQRRWKQSVEQNSSNNPCYLFENIWQAAANWHSMSNKYLWSLKWEGVQWQTMEWNIISVHVNTFGL